MQLDLLKSKQGEERRECKVIPGWSCIDMEPDDGFKHSDVGTQSSLLAADPLAGAQQGLEGASRKELESPDAAHAA